MDAAGERTLWIMERFRITKDIGGDPANRPEEDL